MASAEPLKRRVRLPSGESKWVPTGKWRGIYRDADGIKRHTHRPHFSRKTDAKAAAAELEVKAQRQAARQAGTLSPKTKWGPWWELVEPRRAKELAGDGPAMEKKRVEAIVRPHWGETPLNRILRPSVQDWVDGLTAKYSPQYVRLNYYTFKVSINKAVEDGILTASPCVGIVLPTVVKRPMPHIEVPEAETISAKMGRGFGDAVELGVETGLRPGELAGFHANRADLKAGWAEVREVFVCRDKTIKPLPKSNKTRGVALTQKAIAIIERNLAGRDLTEGCGYPHTDNSECKSVLVLVTWCGKAVSPDRLQVHIKDAYEKLGLEPKTPYAARRGYATRLAEGGLDPYEASKQMGHESLDQTMDYVQRTSRTRRRVLAALGESVPLAAVGESAGTGTEAGTHLDSQISSDVPIQAHEDVG